MEFPLIDQIDATAVEIAHVLVNFVTKGGRTLEGSQAGPLTAANGNHCILSPTKRLFNTTRMVAFFISQKSQDLFNGNQVN